jgi:DivIVA domain-containing protein
VALIVVVLVGVAALLIAAVALSIAAGGLDEATVDHSDLGLPDRALTADDIPALRFRTGVRGYRMEDVDAALGRVAESLRAAQSGADQPRAGGPRDPSGPEAGTQE